MAALVLGTFVLRPSRSTSGPLRMVGGGGSNATLGSLTGGRIKESISEGLLAVGVGFLT